MSLITEEEKQRRKENVEAANFSVDLEGFINTDENIALQARYINGEIDSTELARIIRAKYGTEENA